MRIDCLHGYFKFYEERPGQVFEFATLFGLDVVPMGDYYTLSGLEDAPDYSIVGGTYLDVPAIATFEGPPWEVMRANKIIYNFSLDLAQSRLTVTSAVKAVQAESYYISTGLMVPGSFRDDGLRVTDYSAWFSKDTMKFKYSQVTYE